jgi:hypothetical protein
MVLSNAHLSAMTKQVIEEEIISMGTVEMKYWHEQLTIFTSLVETIKIPEIKSLFQLFGDFLMIFSKSS